MIEPLRRGILLVDGAADNVEEELLNDDKPESEVRGAGPVCAVCALLGDVAQWLESQGGGGNSNPKTLGSIPWRDRVRYCIVFFCPSESTRVQICLCLTSLRVYDTHPNLCAH